MVKVDYDIPGAGLVNESLEGIENDEVQIEFEEEISAPENADIESTSHQNIAKNFACRKESD